MENNINEKNKRILSRITMFGITLCFLLCGLFAVGHKPIKRVYADQSVGGDGSLITTSTNYYRTFLPFDTFNTYVYPVNSTLMAGLDLNYFFHNGASVTSTSPTIPNYSLRDYLIDSWGYVDEPNLLFFDTSTSWYSDFNVQCVDSFWLLGGNSYAPDEHPLRFERLVFSLSQPILVDHTAGDVNFGIVGSSYDSMFCVNWTYRVLYTLIYVDNNGEQQTVNVTSSSPDAVELGQVYNIMPALPSNADLNYPYLLYNYRLVLTPFSPSGAVSSLTWNYALPLFRFDSFAYMTVDYRYLAYEFYDTNITIVNPVDNWVESIHSFFFDSIHGFLSTEILPGVSFYWILFICVGIPILIAILKIWLGG